jgi:hypothetical protein
VVLVLGLVINKKLEKLKIYQTKEKDWKSIWASKFIDVAHDYSINISSCATRLSILTQIANEKNIGWENESKEYEGKFRQNIRRLQYLEWEIQNYVQFAPMQKDPIMETSHTLFSLFSKLIQEKQGNLEEIRKVQFRFNELVRLAHAEILGLDLK